MAESDQTSTKIFTSFAMREHRRAPFYTLYLSRVKLAMFNDE